VTPQELRANFQHSRRDSVRALLIGALALTLLGCSHSTPPQAATTSCPGVYGSDCGEHRATGQPLRLASFKSHSTKPGRKFLLAAKAAKASPAHARVRLAAHTPKSTVIAARAEPHAAHGPLPRGASPSPAGGIVAVARPETRTIQEQVAFATAAAEQAAPASPNNADSLVAVVMARPDIKSISELAGKTIAIDDKYSATSGTVRTAIVAAGAPEVELSEGEATAITRLTNGEVPAAVLALVSPEAADMFPDIAGFRIFQVPLSPRSVKARP
jgi:hypothetical protein